MNKSIILKKIDEIQPIHPLTNCYSMGVIEKADRIWEIGESFMFSYKDHGVNRLIYFAKNETVKDDLLNIIQTGIYYLEFMTRKLNEYTPGGTRLIARMMRVSNLDCTTVLTSGDILKYKDKTIGEKARLLDVKEINKIFWNIFSTEKSHLITDKELEKIISKGNITIHRSFGIDAILQVEVQPKKFYINQIVNLGNRKNIHAMLINRLEEYVSEGGKYIYAWVDSSNMASVKFHQKYGMHQDGLWSNIYCLNRCVVTA